DSDTIAMKDYFQPDKQTTPITKGELFSAISTGIKKNQLFYLVSTKDVFNTWIDVQDVSVFSNKTCDEVKNLDQPQTQTPKTTQEASPDMSSEQQ
ncbi:MAG: hypothetical protein ACXWQQ_08745, partial [Pseudobdellovibrio sp.]